VGVAEAALVPVRLADAAAVSARLAGAADECGWKAASRVAFCGLGEMVTGACGAGELAGVALAVAGWRCCPDSLAEDAIGFAGGEVRAGGSGGTAAAPGDGGTPSGGGAIFSADAEMSEDGWGGDCVLARVGSCVWLPSADTGKVATESAAGSGLGALSGCAGGGSKAGTAIGPTAA
jgi:hypothetical protein